MVVRFWIQWSGMVGPDGSFDAGGNGMRQHDFFAVEGREVPQTDGFAAEPQRIEILGSGRRSQERNDVNVFGGDRVRAHARGREDGLRGPARPVQ